MGVSRDDETLNSAGVLPFHLHSRCSSSLAADGSFTHHPAPLLARHLGVRPVVFFGILNGRHAVHRRRPFEVNAFVHGAGCARSGMFLENALGGTRVGVGVARHL